MDRSSRSVIKRLEEAGFIHVRTRGSHHYFKKDGKPLICVPHPKKDLPIGTYNSIITTAGI